MLGPVVGIIAFSMHRRNENTDQFGILPSRLKV